MDAGVTEELGEILELLSGGVPGFTTRLVELDIDWKPALPRISGRFYYLSFKDGIATAEDFIKFLRRQVVPFCIPRSERERVERRIRADYKSNIHLYEELHEKAAKLFVRAKKSKKTSGEPGELVLYLLLEHALKAPQIVSKMYLKTSQNMPVHGTDGIHLGYDQATDVLSVYWGESKMYNSLSDALTSALESVAVFTNEGSMREREIEVLLDHGDVGKLAQDFKEKVICFFDPYNEKSLKTREVHGCFLGFDYSVYNKLSSMPPDEVESFFRGRYENRIQTACELIEKRIGDRGLADVNFTFFLLPFKSVQEFREQFLGALGGGA